MEDVTVVKVIRVVDLEASDIYEVSQHAESYDWLSISSQGGGDLTSIRKETAVALAKAILEVFQ